MIPRFPLSPALRPGGGGLAHLLHEPMYRRYTPIHRRTS